jgi:hypothetical protein
VQKNPSLAPILEEPLGTDWYPSASGFPTGAQAGGESEIVVERFVDEEIADGNVEPKDW